MSATPANIAIPRKTMIGRLFSFKPADDRHSGPGSPAKLWSKFGLRKVNALLFAGIALMTVYLVAAIASAAAVMRKDAAVLSGAETGAKTFAPLKSPLKAEEYYLGKAQIRSLFSRTTKTEAGAASSGPSQAIIDATKNLRLVGIAWSDNPDAMIEDAQSQATLFLKKGQMVVNEVYVKEIMKNKVILRYKGEEMELE